MGERQDRLLRYANLPHPLDPRTFDGFTPIAGAEEALQAAKAFAQGVGPHVLLLIGQSGTGKSHLLEAIGREALRNNKVVKYQYVPTLLEELRATYDDDSGESALDVMEMYQGADVLLLDDLGTEAVKRVPGATPWVVEKVTTLVDERYRNGHRLAIATNLTRFDVERIYGPRLASRLWDVATGAVREVTMTCLDYRLSGA